MGDPGDVIWDFIEEDKTFEIFGDAFTSASYDSTGNSRYRWIITCALQNYDGSNNRPVVDVSYAVEFTVTASGRRLLSESKS